MTHAAKQLRTLDPDTQFADPSKFGTKGHSTEFIPFIETEDGIAYIEQIRSILAKAKKPLCTRDIHKRLAANAMPRHTLDALLALRAEEHPAGGVTRFSLPSERREITDMPFNRQFIPSKPGKHRSVEPGYLFPNRQQLPVREAEV